MVQRLHAVIRSVISVFTKATVRGQVAKINASKDVVAIENASYTF